jgi:hypothetical protein
VNELFESLIGSSTPLGIGIEFHQEPVNSVEEALCQSADLDHHEPRFRRTEDYLPPIANEVQNLPALAGPAFARFCTVGVDERATRSVKIDTRGLIWLPEADVPIGPANKVGLLHLKLPVGHGQKCHRVDADEREDQRGPVALVIQSYTNISLDPVVNNIDDRISGKVGHSSTG